MKKLIKYLIKKLENIWERAENILTNLGLLRISGKILKSLVNFKKAVKLIRFYLLSA